MVMRNILIPLLLIVACRTAALAQGISTGELNLTPKYLVQEPTTASESADSAELAKKLTNPVARRISVPFQFNYDEGFGPQDAFKLTLNIQPVVPLSLNEEWNLIIRTIVPVVYQDPPADGISSEFGLGDTTQSFFFSPKKPTAGGWIWAIGPVFLWPTGTDDLLDSGKWGAGPTALVLKQDHGWTYGMLANHLWSYAVRAVTRTAPTSTPRSSSRSSATPGRPRRRSASTPNPPTTGKEISGRSRSIWS